MSGGPRGSCRCQASETLPLQHLRSTPFCPFTFPAPWRSQRSRELGDRGGRWRKREREESTLPHSLLPLILQTWAKGAAGVSVTEDGERLCVTDGHFQGSPGQTAEDLSMGGF